MLAILCLPLVTAAHKETFDVAAFAAPSGWERLSGPGPRSFLAKGGAAQIFLFPSRLSGGSPEENFQADWAKLVTAALGKLDVPKLAIERRPDGWIAVSGAANKGQGLAVVLYTATGFGRVMSIVASVAAQEHLPAVRDFFAGLELRGNITESPPKPEASLAVAGSGSPLAGLYVHLQVGMGGGARLEVRTNYFLPGNRITRTFLFGGGDSFDASRCSPDTCGSYTLESGQIHIRWDNGQVDRWPWRHTPEGIHIDGKLYRSARPLREAVLAGTWTGAGQTGDSFSNAYRFERDGTFTFGTGQGGLPGHYRVQELTLILTFRDGTERRRTLFATGPSEPAGMICVDGEVYARRQ